MAGATLTTVASILKEDYKELVEQLNDDVFMLSQLERSPVDAQGLRAYHPIHVTRNSGIGSRATTDTLPTAGAQGYTKTLVPVRFHTGRIKINIATIELSRNDKGSFIRALEAEMSRLQADLSQDHSRQVWGTSDGVIATTGTTSSSTTVQLATTTTETQMRQLFNDGGMLVDIGTVASPTSIASARAVTAVDYTNKTITISGAAVSTVNNTSKIFRSGNGGASDGTSFAVDDGQKELTGLQTIVSDTGVLHAVDPATYSVWKSKSYSNSGTARNVSETMVVKAIQQTAVQSGQSVNLLVCNEGVHRALYADMQAMRRNIDNVALKAGYSGIDFSAAGINGRNAVNRALVLDRDCPQGKLYGLSTDDLIVYEVGDWAWMDADGEMLSRVTNEAAYEATIYRLYETAAKRRNSHFVISDLNEA